MRGGLRLFLLSLMQGVTLVPVKKQKEKLPFEIIEEKFGKEKPVKSDEKIKAFLNSNGYTSLSKLLEV